MLRKVKCHNTFLNVKTIVAAFNQGKALEEEFRIRGPSFPSLVVSVTRSDVCVCSACQ